MKSIAPGVKEIRIHVDVLNAFAKATPKTPKATFELARARYQEVLKMENRNK